MCALSGQQECIFIHSVVKEISINCSHISFWNINFTFLYFKMLFFSTIITQLSTNLWCFQCTFSIQSKIKHMVTCFIILFITITHRKWKYFSEVNTCWKIHKNEWTGQTNWRKITFESCVTVNLVSQAVVLHKYRKHENNEAEKVWKPISLNTQKKK